MLDDHYNFLLDWSAAVAEPLSPIAPGTLVGVAGQVSNLVEAANDPEDERLMPITAQN